MWFTFTKKRLLQFNPWHPIQISVLSFVPVVGLMREYGHEVASVAILTPYKAQLTLLRSTFAAQHSKAALANVEYATVDGFQVCPCFFMLSPQPMLAFRFACFFVLA